MTYFDTFFDKQLERSKRFEYVLLDKTNYNQINKMFTDDNNPFTEDFYKNGIELNRYFEFYNSNIELRGRDWLVQSIENKEYVGVFHLFDLSCETINNRNKRCTIGFAIKPDCRRKYYATEVIIHILRYIFNQLPIEKVLAYTDKKNLAVCNLLKNTGFTFNPDDYMYSDTTHHFEITKNYYDSKWELN